MRGLLDRAGTSRRELIELLEPRERLSDARIVQELLGLSPAEASIIQTELNFPEDLGRLWILWGLQPNASNLVEIFDTEAGEPLDPMEPLDALRKVSILMQQARVSWTVLQEILQTMFVEPNGMLEPEPADECEPSKLVIGQLGGGHLDRMHRFIRLWRRLGWSIGTLAFALHVLPPSPGKLTDGTLQSLSHIKRHQALLNLPVETLVSWYGLCAFVYRPYAPPGKAVQDTLYERLFHNPVVQNPPDPVFALASSDPPRLDPSTAGKTITEYAAVIAAAFGIRQNDLLQIQEESGLPDRLTLDNLYELYRSCSLADALGLTVEDYFALQRVAGCEPFSATAATIAFCDALELLRGSGFTVEEFAYLLRHETRAGSALPLNPIRVSEILGAIRSALQARLLEA